MRFYLGIDPGVSGGLALLDCVGRHVGHMKMPTGEAAIVEGVHDLRRLAIDYNDAVGAETLVSISALIEDVHSSPGWGHKGAFTFGRNLGAVLAACHASRWFDDVNQIAPVKWQNMLGCRTGGQKNVSKAAAQELFPDIKMTHGWADAFLLAECARKLDRRVGSGSRSRKET